VPQCFEVEEPNPNWSKIIRGRWVGDEDTFPEEEIYANEPLIYQLVISKDSFQECYQENWYDCNLFLKDLLFSMNIQVISSQKRHVTCGTLCVGVYLHLRITSNRCHFTGALLDQTIDLCNLHTNPKIQKFETQWNNTCKNKPNLMLHSDMKWRETNGVSVKVSNDDQPVTLNISNNITIFYIIF